jgi:hypothetical protein
MHTTPRKNPFIKVNKLKSYLIKKLILKNLKERHNERSRNEQAVKPVEEATMPG